MPQQQRRPKQVDESSAREGSRWVGERPTADQVAEWFQSIPLDEGMKHEDHIGGITIISATETIKRIINGEVTDVERLVHVPYPRVDARIAYFWQLCELRGWVGEIEPVLVPRVRESGLYNEHLPPGLSKFAVALADKRVVYYVVSTHRVAIMDGTGTTAKPVRKPSTASKQVALLDRWGRSDDNALMKAETGSIGRALGMAGIFVIPGAGVATAEDMQEFLSASGSAGVTPGAQEPALPADSTPEEATIDQRIAELLERVEKHDDPTIKEHFQAWVRERSFDLADLRESQKRGVLRRLEQLLADAASR